MMAAEKVDLVAVTETWFSEKNNWDITIPGYSLYRKDREGRKGGGVALYVKNNIKTNQIKVSEVNIESVWVTLTFGNHTVARVGVIYRPPGQAEELDNLLVEEIAKMAMKGEVIIMGDFNLPDVNWKTKTAGCTRSTNILNSLLGLSLTQVVEEPTRKEAILDLILTNGGLVSDVVVGENLGSSDHQSVWFNITTGMEPHHTRTKVLDFKKTDFSKMRFCVKESLSDWRSLKGVQEKWDYLKEALLKATGNCIRLVSKNKKGKKPLWYSAEVAKIVKNKKTAFNNYKTTQSEEDRQTYKIRQKEAKQFIRASKAHAEEKIAQSVKKGDKTFFRYINEKRKVKQGLVRLKTKEGRYVEEDKSLADCLNEYFCSVFAEEKEGKGPQLGENTKEIFTYQFTEEEVLQQLSKVKTNKSMGPDGIHPKLLKELSDVIAKPLTDLFNQSLLTGVVPEDWKLANVVPIYKKGSREESGNYRPVSLTSVVGKLMETMLKERIVEHLKTHRLQDQKQHGFTSGRSCQTNLIDFFDWVTKIIDTGGAVDIAYLDFSKAFDTVPHRRLINKLQSLSLDSNIVDWIRQWLSDRQQRVVVNGVYSAQGLVTSGVPQGSVLGPILFNIFISDIAEGINGKVCLFADDTKICNRVDVPGGISQMTNDLGKLKKWSELWQLSFNVDKCKIMHLGRKNPRAEYRIFDTVLTSTSEERDLGVIISEDLRVSSQCNRAAGNASRMLGCVGRGISSRKREVLMPLYRALVRPHLEYCVQYWRPYLQKDIDILERVQRRATKMVYGLKEKSYQERLNDLNMYSLEKRRDRGDMIETFKYVKGIHKVEEGGGAKV
uniref:Reverse transcriptase domain-containing protein n=1 Tax=Leptobrachium leishanense TaxID=445787 RepID=A0A8C5MGG2_9ANUR